MTPNAQILATVGNKTITTADVDAFIAGLGQRGAQFATPDGRKKVLEQLVNNQLFLMDASRNLYEADPVFKAELARAKESILISFAIDKAVSSVTVTDAEAQKYYEENQDKFKSEAQVGASHILVEDEALANSLLADIKNGKVTFEDAAREHSKCPSGQQGGSLGMFGRGQMVPEFDQACFEMEVGELRGPVKTDFGYHIIRLDKKEEAGVIPFAEIAREVKGMLLQEKQKNAYDRKVNQMKILYPVQLF